MPYLAYLMLKYSNDSTSTVPQYSWLQINGVIMTPDILEWNFC